MMVDTGNTAFVLLCAAMIFFMVPGLAFFYSGLVRKKNALTIMMQSFISIGVVALVWFICGFSLAFGKDVNGIIGNFQYAFLKGVGVAPNSLYAPTIPFIAFFLFQLMFAIITPALITGAFADRFEFKSYLVFLVLWTLLVYAPAAHWIWGGGFLQKLGAADFAGGITIHTTAGISALVTVLYLGKRKLNPGENVKPHNVTYVALGTGMLWFGWFAFNGGSALAANATAAIACANTAISGAIAMLTWFTIAWIQNKHPSFVEALTGAVAGLAAVTPASGYVAPWAAAVIGLCAGSICYCAVLLRKKAGWDDALDVWGVHGVGGMLGSILLGIFAQSIYGGVNGILGGNPKQFLIQLLAVAFTAGYSVVSTFVILKVIHIFLPVRVTEAEELRGLDESIFQEDAYDEKNRDAEHQKGSSPFRIQVRTKSV